MCDIPMNDDRAAKRAASRAALDAAMAKYTAATAALCASLELEEEQQRARRLAAGLPPVRHFTPEETRAAAALLRAENDALEVEQIADRN